VKFRKVHTMTEQELLSLLGPEPQKQITLFVKLGGDPHDHDYARLSFLTQKLRKQGIPVRSDRQKGLWLEAQS